MKRLQLTGLSGVLVSFAIISGGYTSVAAAAMNDSETIIVVGDAPTYPSKSVIQNAVNSKDHTTLVIAVKIDGLVNTLSEAGPFTVFAPTNEAFAALPAGTVDKLLKPESRPTLIKILTYHVVPGRLTARDLTKAVADGDGKAMLKTIEGDPLTVMQKGDHPAVTNDKGEVAMATIGSVYQSNDVIRVMDKVLVP